jgi:hypothetical protein
LRDETLKEQRTFVVAHLIGGDFGEFSDPRKRKRIEQVTYWKQRETENSTPKIDVMTNTMWMTPIHPGQKVKSFG